MDEVGGLLVTVFDRVHLHVVRDLEREGREEVAQVAQRHRVALDVGTFQKSQFRVQPLLKLAAEVLEHVELGHLEELGGEQGACEAVKREGVHPRVELEGAGLEEARGFDVINCVLSHDEGGVVEGEGVVVLRGHSLKLEEDLVDVVVGDELADDGEGLYDQEELGGLHEVSIHPDVLFKPLEEEPAANLRLREDLEKDDGIAHREGRQPLLLIVFDFLEQVGELLKHA
mmetsp:Transcript_10650/g.17899  ORF Transcript_10650/g.17899 Transcript_10650/m.17899 type:complete len:229 (-) Transcript_10650:268-954(-)